MANNAAHNTATTEPLDRATPDVSLSVTAVAAAPATSLSAAGVTGGISDRATVTINALDGESFGPSPTVFNHDDFRAGAGQNDLSITSGQDRVKGTYYGAYGKYHTQDYRSSGASAVMAGYENGVGTRTNLRMTTDPNGDPDDQAQTLYGEVFLSYALKCPGGYLPFGQSVSVPTFRTFDPGSDWKPAWLMQGNRGDWDGGWAGGNDVVLPTNVGSRLINLGNNGGTRTPDWPTGVTDNWCWDEWARLSVWLSDITGTYYMRYEMPGGVVITDAGPMTNPLNGGGVDGGMNVLKICSWIREYDQEGLLILLDDVYWAAGPNSSSRVEILNGDTYATSDNSTLCNILDWQDQSITVEILTGPNALADIKQLAVITGGDTIVTSRATV